MHFQRIFDQYGPIIEYIKFDRQIILSVSPQIINAFFPIKAGFGVEHNLWGLMRVTDRRAGGPLPNIAITTTECIITFPDGSNNKPEFIFGSDHHRPSRPQRPQNKTGPAK